MARCWRGEGLARWQEFVCTWERPAYAAGPVARLRHRLERGDHRPAERD